MTVANPSASDRPNLLLKRLALNLDGRHVEVTWLRTDAGLSDRDSEHSMILFYHEEAERLEDVGRLQEILHSTELVTHAVAAAAMTHGRAVQGY